MLFYGHKGTTSPWFSGPNFRDYSTQAGAFQSAAALSPLTANMTGSGDPETWGKEVPVGTGDVDWTAFFGVCKQAGYSGNLIIEREAGDQRIADINKAQQLLFASANKVA